MADHDITGMVIARVTITRVLDTDGDIIDHVSALSADGIDDLGLAEALGMLRLAEHTLIQSYEDTDE